MFNQLGLLEREVERLELVADSMDLALELQKIYDSEINIRISWLRDGGIDVMIGAEVNGYEAAENVQSINEGGSVASRGNRALLSGFYLHKISCCRREGARRETALSAAGR